MTPIFRESSPFPRRFNELPTPLHLFSEASVREDARSLAKGLREAIPTLELYYSAKTNALPALLRLLLSDGWGIELVCPGDRRAAAQAGAPGDRLLLNGAAWTKAGLEEAVFADEVGQVTLDSLAMADLLQKVLLSSRSRPPLRVALRLHDGDSHFGFPADALQEAHAHIPSRGVAATGLHLHRNSPGSPASLDELSADFSSRCRQLLPLAESLPVSFLDLGGGIDSPWVYRPPPAELGDFHSPSATGRFRAHAGRERFSLLEAGRRIGAGLKAVLGEQFGRWQIQLEPGRSICTRALSTLLEVRAAKRGLYPDADIIVTDGNTAILGPLHRGVHPLRAEKEGERRCFVYGNLPHSGDWLFQAVNLPWLEPGERIQILHTGAYFLAMEANFGLPRPGIYDEISGAVLRKPEAGTYFEG
jgi:diaminopimelate decarboxylase